MSNTDKVEYFKLYSYSIMKNEVEVTYYVNNADESGGHKSLLIPITDLREVLKQIPEGDI